MNEDTTGVFRYFRVLVFPVSLNAIALGALATLLFYGCTWVLCAIDGDGSRAGLLAEVFPRRLLAAIVGMHWPSVGGWLLAAQTVVFFLLWATFGVAICRILALRVARDEICTMKGAWSFAWGTKVTALLFPLAILMPVAFLVVCNALLGGLGSIPHVGWIIGVIFFPLVMISSLIILLALAAGLFSLGLIPAVIAVERKGTFDAAGKATNCLTARPLPTMLYLGLMYVFIAYIVHGPLIEHRLLEHVCARSLTPFWDSTFTSVSMGQTEAHDGFASAMAWVYLGFWKIYRLLVWGLIINLILGGFTSIFLILRQDVDGITPEDVARDPRGAPPAPAPAPEPTAPKAPPPDAESRGE